MNKCDNSYEEAINKIKDFNKHRIISYCCFGPTGPTERLFKSSNKIIIDSS